MHYASYSYSVFTNTYKCSRSFSTIVLCIRVDLMTYLLLLYNFTRNMYHHVFLFPWYHTTTTNDTCPFSHWLARTAEQVYNRRLRMLLRIVLDVLAFLFLILILQVLPIPLGQLVRSHTCPLGILTRQSSKCLLIYNIT